MRHVLAVLRLELGLGQKEMADLGKCSRATIQAVELDHLKLSGSLALRISLETGVEVSWLLKNNLKEPIRLSTDASVLVGRSDNISFRERRYTKKVFELVQANRHKKEGPQSSWYEIRRGLEDHAHLRAIMESARKRHLLELARYKLDKFLEELREEFGFASELVDLEDVYQEYDPNSFSKARAFLTKELGAIEKLEQVIHDDRDPDVIPKVERERLDKLMILFRVASPYEDFESAETIRRVDEAYKEEMRLREDLKAVIKKRLQSGQPLITAPRPIKKRRPSA